MKDSKLSDDELIEKSRQGDRASTNELMERYKSMVSAKAASMYIPGADHNDLIQEGMIGLFAALQDYDFGRDASFATFADLCVSRQLYSAVTAYNRQKHQPLNGYVSLTPMEESTDDGNLMDRLQKTLQSGFQLTPEEIVIDQENVEKILHIIQTELSDMEKKILDLHLMKLSYDTIAGVLNISKKSVDNGLQRIKNKIRKAMKLSEETGE